MSLVGQPQSYSNMLTRIFWATLIAGVLCTFALASVSPAARNFLESWSAGISIAVLDSVKALYVLVPLGLAILSRVFLLHDKVSDLFGIRRRFDLKNILRPLAEGVGFPVAGADWMRVEESRDLAMTRTFYRYASFTNPRIDIQMVRTAADRWAWFWCTVEPQVILIAACSIFVVLRAWSWLLYLLSAIVVLILVGALLWPQLRKGARTQVAEILDNECWREEVRSALYAIAATEDAPSRNRFE